MDFAALISAQIASKRAEYPVATSSKTASNKSNYLKRSELEATREAAYIAEQTARESDRQRRNEQKRRLQVEDAARSHAREAKRKRLAEVAKKLDGRAGEMVESERQKMLDLPETSQMVEKPQLRKADKSFADKDDDDMEEEELLTRLRAIKEPARMFGENHQERLVRYKLLRDAPSIPFDPPPQFTQDSPIPTSLQPVADTDMQIPAVLPSVSDTQGRLFVSRQITSWFNLVLQEWGKALAGRAESTQRTYQGQAAANSMTQAIRHLVPLFRKLERLPYNPSELPQDLFAPIADIVRAAQERRYVNANDGYLQLSIGKAAWPIGVTMVGIHERSAREKLHEGDKGKAHIMADEVTRKILQSIKRCLSFAQIRWPPEDTGQLMG